MKPNDELYSVLNDRYLRANKYDKRIGRGDDFAGDAWLDRVDNKIKMVVVGVNPNNGDDEKTLFSNDEQE